jgi:hypothetical protein
MSGAQRRGLVVRLPGGDSGVLLTADCICAGPCTLSTPAPSRPRSSMAGATGNTCSTIVHRADGWLGLGGEQLSRIYPDWFAGLGQRPGYDACEAVAPMRRDPLAGA